MAGGFGHACHSSVERIENLCDQDDNRRQEIIFSQGRNNRVKSAEQTTRGYQVRQDVHTPADTERGGCPFPSGQDPNPITQRIIHTYSPITVSPALTRCPTCTFSLTPVGQ